MSIRQVRVKGIPEADELASWVSLSALPIERISALLEHYATVDSTEDASWVRQLTLGDREALLLHILRLTFGNAIPCTLPCPACREFMDFELQTDQLLLPSMSNPKQFHQEEFVSDGTSWHVRFHAPRACDVEASMDCGRMTANSAAVVLRHCVEEVWRETGPSTRERVAHDRWPAELNAQIVARLAEIDPQAEMVLQLACPACENHFSSAFDTGNYLLRELETRERQLLYDVHRLAMAYHWSEEAILRMTRRKRKQYLEMVEDGLQ